VFGNGMLECRASDHEKFAVAMMEQRIAADGFHHPMVVDTPLRLRQLAVVAVNGILTVVAAAAVVEWHAAPAGVEVSVDAVAEAAVPVAAAEVVVVATAAAPVAADWCVAYWRANTAILIVAGDPPAFRVVGCWPQSSSSGRERGRPPRLAGEQLRQVRPGALEPAVAPQPPPLAGSAFSSRLPVPNRPNHRSAKWPPS
jgi:hypothetical protein